jgi:hypothetical protein
VVDEFLAKTHHRDTENTEVAQRNLKTRTFEAKPPSFRAVYDVPTRYRRWY